MGNTYDVTDHYDRVMRFMQHAGQVTRSRPEMPTTQERVLRAKLILEECLETIRGLGCQVVMGEPVPTGESIEMPFVSVLDASTDHPPSLVEIADGCADVAVVVTGTLIACGIRDVDLQRLVDENNLAKFGPGGYRRGDGKWIKPADHKAPDIRGLLIAQNSYTSGPQQIPGL